MRRRTFTIVLFALTALGLGAGTALGAGSGKLGNFEIQLFRGELGNFEIQLVRGKAPALVLELDGATRAPAGGDTGTHEVGHVAIRLTARTVVARCNGRAARLGNFEIQDLVVVLGRAKGADVRVRRAKGTEPTAEVDGAAVANGTATRVQLSC
ncbi:MAG: hypothetical protein R3C15_19955 [Thermoleophilia bacterium]